MNLDISGQHIEITPGLKDHVTEKFNKIQEHIDNITSAHVVLIVEKSEQKAEIQLHAGSSQMFASAVNSDMYAAIDDMFNKVHRQAIKYKEKIKSHKVDKTVKPSQDITDND